MVPALTVADVGSRVVVRRRVSGGPRPLYTDLLGELQAVTAEEVTIVTKAGAVRVPLKEIHRAKRVPDIAAVELAATLAWPPAEVEFLGQWRLRAAGGYTGRANSALPIGDPGVPLMQAFRQIEDFYTARGLPPRIDVPLPLAAAIRKELIKQGWREECQVLVQTMPIDRLLSATPPGDACTLSATPSPAMLALIAGRRGPLPEAALHVLTAVPLVAFCEYAESIALLSMGRGTVTNGYLGLYAIETVPQARRRGLAREVLGALARWGYGNGATAAFLQVESTNAEAIALYEKLGFRTHHRYARYKR